MKRMTALLWALLPIALFAQAGIYKTLQDFKDQKLSNSCEEIHTEKLLNKYFLILVNKGSKEKIPVTGSEIWGFKTGMTDYRIINNTPYSIASKGELWIYSMGGHIGINPKTSDTTFYKTSTALPYASKGVNGNLVQIGGPKDLYAMMDAPTAEKVKAAVKAYQVTYYLEDMGDYYNSLRPGHLSTRFKGFYLDGLNKTADGKRKLSF